MIRKQASGAAALSFGALILSACVSQTDYDAAVAQNQQLKAQLAALQAEQKYVEAGDLLFPSGGYQLSPAGQAELANNIAPKLRGLQNAKIVVSAIPTTRRLDPTCSARASPTTWYCRRGAPPPSCHFSCHRESIPISSRPRESATRVRSPRTIRRKAGRKTAGSRLLCRGRAPEPRGA